MTGPFCGNGRAAFLAVALLFAAVTNASAGAEGWVSTGNLNVARTGHTATLLQDGSVLVVGGRSDLDSAELYDPVSRKWRVTGSPAASRTGHTATLLQDGRVLAVGGEYSARSEIYDPRTGTWSSNTSPSTWHDGHTATLLPNGKVLVTGGTNYRLFHAAELYEPATGRWSDAGAPKWSRIGHTATLLEDGTVLVAGGQVADWSDEMLRPTASKAEIYNPDSGLWSEVGVDMFIYGHTATLLHDGQVLITGGQTDGQCKPAWCYGRLYGTALFDPVTGVWRTSNPMTAYHQGHTASLLADGKVLVVGGRIGIETDVEEILDPVAKSWAGTSGLNIERSGHTATRLSNGDVLVAGGSDGQSPIADVELFVGGARPPGTIGPAFTGSWFDPAQSGHGLFVEVLPGNQFLAAWFTFDPAGMQQSWFLGVGSYYDNTATLSSVVKPTGGRWIPNFDPSRIVNSAWGTLKFTFTDCNHGKVEFASTAGYGAGSMNLTRLTQPAGLTCP